MMSRPVDLSNAAAAPVHFSRQKFAGRPEHTSRKIRICSAADKGSIELISPANARIARKRTPLA
jgi:hypothetical protein